MSNKVKIGFVGTGGIANHHLRQLKDIEEAEIVALCDIVEEKAQAAVETYGGTAYTDYRKMIDEQTMDAMYVCIPPFAHEDAEILAAQKGIHLFVEKPVALTMEKGIEVCEAIEKADVMSCVGYSMRYSSGAAIAKKFLADKTIAMVACDRWGGVPGTPWWRVMDESGGQLVEMATHQVDMIRYLAGEVKEVYARYALRTLQDMENFTVPDVQAVLMEFDSGAVGYISTSCALVDGGGQGRLEFVLEDMRMIYGGSKPQIRPKDAAEIEPLTESILSIDEAFISAVSENKPELIKTPYPDALRSLDVTLAANKSAVEGKPVQPRLS